MSHKPTNFAAALKKSLSGGGGGGNPYFFFLRLQTKIHNGVGGIIMAITDH